MLIRFLTVVTMPCHAMPCHAMRKGGNTYSSPVGIGDKVYFVDDTGLCTMNRRSSVLGNLILRGMVK